MQVKEKLKALLQSIAFIALYIALGAILSQLKPLFPEQFERYAQGILGTIAVALVVWIFLKIEKKSLIEYGLNWEKKSLSKFFVGLAVGIVLAIIMIFSQIFYSGLEVTMTENVNLLSFFFWSLAFIPLAFMEEVAFRSYPLIRLKRAFGLRTTQLVLGLLFALYHVVMMWSVQASFLGPGIWALAYAITAVASNGIAVPTGLHFGLNFIQSVIGGQKGIKTIWEIDFPAGVSESEIATNENFGIALQISLLILCLVATELYIRRKKTPGHNIYDS